MPTFRKRIFEMTSRSQIRNRKKIYRDFLKNTFRRFPDAVSANVSLNIGTEWVQIPLGFEDLNPNIPQDGILGDIYDVQNDHTYSLLTKC